jgi:hypothetical protein
MLTLALQKQIYIKQNAFQQLELLRLITTVRVQNLAPKETERKTGCPFFRGFIHSLKGNAY